MRTSGTLCRFVDTPAETRYARFCGVNNRSAPPGHHLRHNAPTTQTTTGYQLLSLYDWISTLEHIRLDISS
jgi:hypothetical protein